MPVETLAVRFVCVSVHDDSDIWGTAEWHLHASVNGQPVGSSQTEFEARTGELFTLPGEDWTEIVDVASHGPGDEIAIRFKVVEHDLIWNDELGQVTATLRYPYTDPLKFIFLDGPMLPGGLFGEDHRAYSLLITVRHHETFASTNTTGATRIPVTRGARGAATFNTLTGEQFTPRVDVHPVIPVPVPPSHVVRPVDIPPGAAAATNTPAAQVTVAPSAPTLNALPNPSVIPILDPADPDFANRVARVSVTAYEPGNLDTGQLYWKVASGPARIAGSPRGLSVQVHGTGNASDRMAVLEVRWASATGPLLATYRAWVGRLGTLKYRVNLLDGIVPPGSPAGTPAPFQTSTLMPPATAHSIMQVVQAILYQAGILLVPDDDVTCWEGATLTATGNAVFQVPVTNNQHTNNVNHGVISSSTRYNFRPGVVNFAIVFSTSAGNAAAVERNGIEGTPDTGKHLARDMRYTYNGSGVEKKLDGAPSSSWIKPAGVARDGDAVEQAMETIAPTDRVAQGRVVDKDFIKARRLVDPGFSKARLGELYACQVPARWSVGAPAYVWQCGVNFAHELGHVLGLAHRGSGGNSTGPSTDKMSFDTPGGKRGHPWNENVMSYGYAAFNPPLAHDIDLLQASVIRKHPAIGYG